VSQHLAVDRDCLGVHSSRRRDIESNQWRMINARAAADP
jgi:hypothetical protein